MSIKRKLAALLVALAIAVAPAQAAITRYVFTDAQLTAANTAVAGLARASQQGSIIYVYPNTDAAGYYTVAPQSWAQGTGPQHVRYIGASAVVDSVRMSQPPWNGIGTPFPSYTTWQGIRFYKTGFDFSSNTQNTASGCPRTDTGCTGPFKTAKGDSLYGCILDQGFGLNAVDSCVISNCVIGTQSLAVQVGWTVPGVGDGAEYGCRGNIVSDNHMALRAPSSAQYKLWNMDGGFASYGSDTTQKHREMIRFNQILRNVISLVVYDGPSCVGQALYGWYQKFAAFNEISDNTITFTDSTSTCTSTHKPFLIRDLSGGNTFLRDTLTINEPVSNTNILQSLLTGSGNEVGFFGNLWDRCILKSRVHNTGGYNSWSFQNGLGGDIIRNCVVISDSAAAPIGGMFVDPTLPHHWSDEPTTGWDYTIYTPLTPEGVPSRCASLTNNTFFAYKPQGQGGSWSTKATGSFRSWMCAPTVRNNIFYTRGGNATAPSVWWEADSPVDINLIGNYNLYATISPADSLDAIYTRASDGVVRIFKPGAFTQWCTYVKQDCNSLWAPAGITDSTVATFDATLKVGSKAIGRGENGVDIGAIAFSAPVSDSVRPAAITTLQAVVISEHGVRLQWTAVGDDSLTGTATLYDVRVSTSLIDANNFSSATQIATGIAPAVAGTIEYYNSVGLTTDQVYYYAIKTRDELTTHWSAISNVVFATPVSMGGGGKSVIED